MSCKSLEIPSDSSMQGIVKDSRLHMFYWAEKDQVELWTDRGQSVVLKASNFRKMLVDFIFDEAGYPDILDAIINLAEKLPVPASNDGCSRLSTLRESVISLYNVEHWIK